SQLLSAARLAASQAAGFLRDSEGRMSPEQWVQKAHADFVTEVDREAERMITATLTNAVPESIVMGEELTPDTPSHAPGTTPHAPLWIVDPLDGTTNFLHRFPVYSVSIAAVVEGELVAAVVHDVPRGIEYSATKGGGAFANGERIRVSTITEPKRA